MVHSTSEEPPKPTVAIVGAGLTGLIIAHGLKKVRLHIPSYKVH